MEQKEIDELEAFLKRTKFSAEDDFKKTLWQQLLNRINQQTKSDQIRAPNEMQKTAIDVQSSLTEKSFITDMTKLLGIQIIDLSDEDVAKVAGGIADNFCHDKKS